jgi:hypothetical protein
MSHDVFRDLIAGRRVRLSWNHRPTAVPRLRTWHLQIWSETSDRAIEIDTGLTTAVGDRYGEIVGRATVKAVACILAMSGVDVTLPSGERFDREWLEHSVRIPGSKPPPGPPGEATAP